MISYLDFAAHLPLGAFDAPTSDELLFNFALLEPSTPSDSMIKGLAHFLDALHHCNVRINEERASQNPPLQPIFFCVKSHTGSPQSPNIQYSITFPVDSQGFVGIVTDPTDP